MFNKKYETRYGDYKDFETIKPSSLLDIVQDVSIRHSDSCGYGIGKLKKMNLAWLIQGINIHIEEAVKTESKIDVNTGIKNFRGTTSERGCILSQNGKVVAKTVANWFLIDTKLMKPVRITEEIASSYGLESFDDEFFKFRKPEILDAKFAYTVKVSNKDIDTNKHLNNQKSAEMLTDALPFDFNFSDASILYKKSAYLGDMLDVCITEIENGYQVQLKANDEIYVVGSFTK